MSRKPTDGLRREQLANGVTVLVQRRRTAPAVSLVTHVRAGFLDESDEVVGISHVLEHMLFKGTPSLGPGELARRTKALGGTLNAYTSYDRTVYYASVPARHAAALAALQADQVRNATLDADELRRELGVIIQEARRKLDSPGAVASETMHELLYTTHRLRRWRIGVDTMLEKFDRNDVAGYYQSRYVPARTIVALVGDIDEDAALDLLRNAWGDWARPAPEIPAGPAEQGRAHVQARRLTGDVALGDVVLGWRGPGVLDPQIPALETAAAILGLGRAARFSRSLRETGLVNSIGVGIYGVPDAGVFSIGTELDPARLDSVLGIIGSTIRELATEPPPAGEFRRARTMLLARVRRRFERFESRAIALADAESLGDVARLDREEDELLAVTPPMVMESVRQWLVPDGVSGVAYLPHTSEVSFDAGMLRNAMAMVSSAQTPVIPTPIEVPVRSRSGRRGPSRPVVHHLALDHFDILTARFGETGQTSLHLYRLRSAIENAGNAGLAALAIRAMARGTVAHDASELAFAMESLGGTLVPSLGADVLGVGATVLTEHVAAAGALLGEVFYHPRFDLSAVAVERGLLRDDARAVADDMVRFPVQLALGVAFNDADYGSPNLGRPESLDSFDASSVREWHRAMLRGGRTTIVAVGDADPEWLAEQVATVIANDAPVIPSEARERVVSGRSLPSLPFGAGDPLGMTTAPLAITPGTRTEHRDRKQSALAMLFPGPSRHSAERFVAETWGAIAAGLGGRLFESLRSRRSLAYTVIASSWQRRRAGGLLTYIATEPSRLAEARDAMLDELDTFRREPPSAEEFARAQAGLIGEVEMGRQTAGAFAAEIADAWLLGEGLDDLDDPAAPYRAVTADDVQALAARSLDPRSRAEGVVAPMATE